MFPSTEAKTYWVETTDKALVPHIKDCGYTSQFANTKQIAANIQGAGIGALKLQIDH